MSLILELTSTTLPPFWDWLESKKQNIKDMSEMKRIINRKMLA